MSREQDIINMICCGLSNKEIAYRAAISPRTVELHVSRALGRRNVQSRTQLIILELTGKRPWEAA